MINKENRDWRPNWWIIGTAKEEMRTNGTEIIIISIIIIIKTVAVEEICLQIFLLIMLWEEKRKLSHALVYIEVNML